MTFIHAMNLMLSGLWRLISNIVADALFPISDIEREIFSHTPESAYLAFPKAERVEPAVFAYKDDRVSRLIWNIKYKKSRDAAKIGAYALYARILSDAVGSSGGAPGSKSKCVAENSVVIPMPVTPRRRRERGYNQCELLAEEILKLDKKQSERGEQGDSNRNPHALGLEVRTDILLRSHHTTRQTLKGRADRLEDAKGVFEVNGKTIEAEPGLLERKIIVIDDVITTGSTMKEALYVLSERGFKNARGLALAH